MPRANDIVPLTDAQRRLITPPVLKVAEILARRAARSVPWQRDEILSAAYLGVVLAAQQFDPGAGLTFRNYAALRAAGAIRDALRECGLKGFRSHPRGAVPASVPRTGTGPRRVPIADGDGSVPDPSLPVGWELDAVDAVAGLLAGLPDQARRWVLAAYTEAAVAGSVAEAARRDGFSGSRAWQAQRAAFDALRGGTSGRA